MFECITDSVDLSLSKLREKVKDMKAWCASGLRVAKCGTQVCDWTKTCQILAHWPGIEATQPALKSKILITGPPGKSPFWVIFLWILLALFLNSLLFMGISSCSILKKLSLLRVITFELKVKLLVTQPRLNLCNTRDCIPAGFSVHGRNSLGNNTAMGNHSLLQRIFLTQGSNFGLPHYR